MTRLEFLKTVSRRERIADRLLSFHYVVEREALKTDDIWGEDAVEYLTDYLDDSERYKDYDTEKIARDLIKIVGDEVVSEIMKRDREAMEDYREFEEARRGEY